MEISILIVDDDKLLVKKYRDTIDWESLGISAVFIAYNIRQAKKILEEYEVPLLLCDIDMPHGSGLELLEYLREQKREIECIFLSSYANFAYAQAAVRYSARDYLLKPISNAELGNRIAQAVAYIREKKSPPGTGEAHNRELPRDFPEKRGQSSIPESEDLKPFKTKGHIIEEMRTYIEEHLDEEISRSFLAKKAGYSESHLSKCFFQETGMNIPSYIASRRIEKAKYYLKNSDLSIGEIALKVGYSNFSYFSKNFKELSGCTPNEYRNQQR